MSPVLIGCMFAALIVIGLPAATYAARALDRWLDQHPGIDLDDLDRPRPDKETP